jgi:uncharacterized protein
MISIENLLQEKLPSNYFAPDIYLQGDFESGLLENRSGDRLIALPEILLEAIYEGLAEEVGPSAGLVLFQCGRWWGKSFYRRFAEQVSEYYEKPLAEMEMIELLQCLKQCWKTHGWGLLDIDTSYYQQGFLVVKVENSAFPQAGPQVGRPMCFAEAGILSSFFSLLTGRELHCVQTSCESMGAECNHFVLGLSDRIKPAEAWLAEGQDHPTIMERLCNNKNGK